MLELFPELLVATISGLIVLGVQVLIGRFGKWTTPSGAPTMHHSTTSVTITQITNNISISANRSSADTSQTEKEQIGLAIGFCIAGTSAFVLYYEFVLASLVGVIIALFLAFVRQAWRSRVLGFTGPVAKAVVEIAIALMAAVAVITGVTTTKRGVLSLDSIRQPQSSVDPVDSDSSGFLTPLLEQLSWLFAGTWENALPFAVSMFLAALSAGILAVSASISVVRWQYYLKFGSGITSNSRAVERGQKFEQQGWGRAGITALTAAFGILLAFGVAFDWWSSINAP